MRKSIKVCILFIMIILTIIVINISKIYAEDEIDVLNERTEKSVAKLTCGDTEKYYDYLDAAIEDSCDYDTITLLKDVNEEGYKNKEDVLKISKAITLEFGTYTIYSRGIYVEGFGPVIFNADKIGDKQGGIITNKQNVHTINMNIQAGGTLKLNNVKITDDTNTDNFATILVAGGTLNLDGSTYISTVSNAIEIGWANVKINNLELLQSKENYAIYFNGHNKDSGTLRISGGKIIEGKKGGIYASEGKTGSILDISGGTIKSQDGAGVTFSSESGNVYIRGGTIESINGPGAVLNIPAKNSYYQNCYMRDGTIKSKNGAGLILNITDKENICEFELRGGQIESANGVGMIVNDVNLVMKEGTIEGIIGLIVNGGVTTVNGGTVSGTGKGKRKIDGIDTNNELELGSAIVNNVSDDKNNSIEIKNGTFNSSENVILSSSMPNSKAFLVKGGIYNKLFDLDYVDDNVLVVHITKADDEKWYVGDAVKWAIEKDKKVSGAVIEVLQGDLSITDATNGLKVKNSGVGNVTANKQEVKKGSEIVVSQSQIGDNSETQNGGNTGEQEGNTSGDEENSQTNGITKISPADNTVAGKKLPATGDVKTIILIGGTLLIAVSAIVAYKKIRKIEGK